MSLLDNKIGTFNFLSLMGNLEPPGEMVEIDQRPGIDGTEITRDGSKGKPFQVLTRVDATTYATAKALLNEYIALKAADPVALIQGGQNTESSGYRVKVLDVVPIRITAVAGGIGGFNSNPLGLIECRWDLISIAIT